MKKLFLFLGLMLPIILLGQSTTPPFNGVLKSGNDAKGQNAVNLGKVGIGLTSPSKALEIKNPLGFAWYNANTTTYFFLDTLSSQTHPGFIAYNGATNAKLAGINRGFDWCGNFYYLPDGALPYTLSAAELAHGNIESGESHPGTITLPTCTALWNYLNAHKNEVFNFVVSESGANDITIGLGANILQYPGTDANELIVTETKKSCHFEIVFFSSTLAYIRNLDLVPVVIPPGGLGTIHSNATGGGNWSLTSTWAEGIVPTEKYNVEVADGDIVNIDINHAAVNKITIIANGAGIDASQLNISANSVLDVDSDVVFQMSNTGHISFNITANGRLNLGGVLLNDTAHGIVTYTIPATITGMANYIGGRLYLNPSAAPTYTSNANAISNGVKVNQVYSINSGGNYGLYVAHYWDSDWFEQEYFNYSVYGNTEQ